jgi:Kdo2-lipid IVA lauroyltransferase/acyltransferase
MMRSEQNRPPPAKSQAKEPDWFHSLRFRLEWLGVKGLTAVVPRLPLGLWRYLAGVAAFAFYYLDRRGRRVALANLEAAFGDLYRPAQRKQIARRALAVFARSFLELFWSPRLNRNNSSTYMTMTGSTEARRLSEKGGVILISVHLANFEWGSGLFALEGQAGLELTQRFRNDRLTPVFRRLREHCGHTIVTQEQSMIRFYKALRKGQRVGLLTDLTLKMNEPGTFVRCFGLWTWTTIMHAALQARTGAPIVPFVTIPQPGGRYEVRLLEPILHDPNRSLRAIAQLCWDRFEPVIAEHPECWLWFYKHWRYQPALPDRPYPFYANRSPWFDLEWEKEIGPIPAELQIY